MKCFVGWRMSAVAVLFTVVMATIAQAQQPTVVFSIRGIEPLLDDADFIGDELGREGAKESAEQLINGFAGGLAGIDRTKPLGAYWNTPAGAPEMPVAFLPVSDVEALKKLLTAQAPDFKDTKGQWTMTIAETKLFAKVSGGYCFVSNMPTALTKLADPTKIVNGKYDIALDVSIASIADELKDAFLTGAESSGKQALDSQPEPASEAEKNFRDLLFDSMMAGMKSLIKDGDRLTLGIDLNEETRLGGVDFGVTGKPNTDMAKSLAAFGKLQPAFAGIGSESAPLRVVISYPTTGMTAQFDAMFDTMGQGANDQIDKDEKLKTDDDRAAVKGLVTKLINIFKATAKTGAMHSGLVLEAGTDKTVRILGATRVAKGDDVNKLVDEALKLSTKVFIEDAEKFKLDAVKVPGVRIHAITPKDDEDTEKYFGEGPAYLAIKSDSVWLAFGGDNLVALKKSLDAKPPTKVAPPISIRIKPGALVGLMEKDDEDLIERAKGIAGKPGDKLNLEITPVPSGAKLRLEVGVDLLKLADKEEDK